MNSLHRYSWLRLWVNPKMLLGAYGAFVGFVMVQQNPIPLGASVSPHEMSLMLHAFGIGMAMPCCIVAGVGFAQQVIYRRRQRRRDAFQEALLA